MKIPEFLKPGDTIAITAPSFGATIEPYISRFNEAIRLFKERGYKIKIGETCYKSDGKGISSNPKICAKELEDFYLDENISAIISCGGGEMMCETCGFLDFEKLKTARPKWFLGYSDNTNFIFPLLTKLDTASIYGPCISGFGKPWELSELYTLDLLEGKNFCVKGFDKFQSADAGTEAKNANPLSKYVFTDEKILVSYECENSVAKKTSKKIEIDGMLVGGCLDVLSNLCGTNLDFCASFNQKYKNLIWVLEACDYNPMDIRRAIWHLDSSSWFKNACGFVIGRPLAAWKENLMGVDQYNAVTDLLSKYNVPIIMDADVGHLSPVVPLVMGSYAQVLAQGNNFSVNMKLL